MEVPTALSRLAHLQDGVVTRDQVTGLGLSRHALARLTRDGHWRRLAIGLYYTASVDPNWSAVAWGGVLLGGPDARLGPSSSAYLHRLEADPPVAVDVFVPPDRRVRVTGPWAFIRDSASGRSRRSIGSPPRLRAEQTVIDLTAHRPADEVVAFITRAVQLRLTTADRLLTELDRRARHPHRALMVGMLGEVAAGAESVLEVMFAQDVERPHGLPVGRRQKSRLGLPYCTDVGYDAFALLVELDGRDGHVGVGRFRDMRRDNRFAAGNLTTFRYGFFDVAHHPCAVAGQLWAVLSARGYSEPLLRCNRCADAPLSDLIGG